MTISKSYNKTPFILIIVLIASGLAGFLLSLHMHRPLQRVYHDPISITAQLKDDPHADQKIFKSFCSACHGNPPNIEVNAPLIGDQKAWMSRKKLGIDPLLKITIEGVGAMPARGGCFECSDEQLQKTIQYMLNS